MPIAASIYAGRIQSIKQGELETLKTSRHHVTLCVYTSRCIQLSTHCASTTVCTYPFVCPKQPDKPCFAFIFTFQVSPRLNASRIDDDNNCLGEVQASGEIDRWSSAERRTFLNLTNSAGRLTGLRWRHHCCRLSSEKESVRESVQNPIGN